jgi:hypothetical protein
VFLRQDALLVGAQFDLDSNSAWRGDVSGGLKPWSSLEFARHVLAEILLYGIKCKIGLGGGGDVCH